MASLDDSHDMLSSQEVAALLGVATATLAKWRLQGESRLEWVETQGQVRYHRQAVELFLSTWQPGPD